MQEAWNSESTQQRHGPYPLGTCELKQFRLQLIDYMLWLWFSVAKTKTEIQSMSEL